MSKEQQARFAGSVAVSHYPVRMKAIMMRTLGYSIGETLAALKVRNTRGAT